MKVDSLSEVILWLKVIIFDSLAYTLKINIENHLTESGKATFSVHNLFVQSENHFSLKYRLIDLVLDSAENQL